MTETSKENEMTETTTNLAQSWAKRYGRAIATVLHAEKTPALFKPEYVEQVRGRMSDQTPDNRSPYCMRCNRKDHGMYEGGFHETNEHDEWFKRVRAKGEQ